MVWPSVLSELWCVYSILPNNVMWFWFMPLFFLFCLLFFLSFPPFPHFSLPVISFFLSFPLRLSFPSFLSPPYFSLLYLISACFSLLYTHLFFSLFPCFVFKGLPDDFWWGRGVGKSWRVLQVSCQIFALIGLSRGMCYNDAGFACNSQGQPRDPSSRAETASLQLPTVCPWEDERIYQKCSRYVWPFVLCLCVLQATG